jgi:hypothetical protein
MKEFPDSRILDFGRTRLAAWPVIAAFRRTIETFFRMEPGGEFESDRY